jgi:transcriptional regulator with XRE-family HTH domain
MAPRSYEDVLARNVAALRTRERLNQELVAERMRALGYSSWLRQTVANVESGKRRLTGGEIHALAWVLETSVAALMRPSDDDKLVVFPAGDTIGAESVQRSAGGSNDGAVQWDGATPAFPPPLSTARQLAAGGLADYTVRDKRGHSRHIDPATGEWAEDEGGTL